MWVFGLFLADGDYNKKDGIRFNLGSHEKSVINKIIKFMRTEYNLAPHIDDYQKSCKRISFYSRDLTSFFLYNFGNGARKKKIPFNFIFYPKEKLLALLNGYNSGDGYNRFRGKQYQFSIYTSSKNLKYMFNLILNRLGIIPIITRRTSKDSEIEGRIIKSTGPGWNIQYKAKNIKNKYFWKDDDYFYIPLSKNKGKNYDDYVYNLTVKDDNSYIASGIPVKNCLRHIDMRVKDGYLIFYPYFRSWDLWNGFPANLMAIAILQNIMSENIGVKQGPILAASKGLHLYDYAVELAKIRAGFDFAGIK
jgi:intein/homing endonuclease